MFLCSLLVFSSVLLSCSLLMFYSLVFMFSSHVLLFSSLVLFSCSLLMFSSLVLFSCSHVLFSCSTYSLVLMFSRSHVPLVLPVLMFSVLPVFLFSSHVLLFYLFSCSTCSTCSLVLPFLLFYLFSCSQAALKQILKQVRTRVENIQTECTLRLSYML